MILVQSFVGFKTQRMKLKFQIKGIKYQIIYYTNKILTSKQFPQLILTNQIKDYVTEHKTNTNW